MVRRTDTPFTPGQPLPLVLTPMQAAYMLNVDYEHVLALLNSKQLGELPYKTGTRRLIPFKAIEEYISAHMQPATPPQAIRSIRKRA